MEELNWCCTKMSETIADVWEDPNKIYPSIVYVETTNRCNYTCLSCLNHRCDRTRGCMTLEDFRSIADKVKARGLNIGAVFCFGEPLMDPTFTDKLAYGKSIGVFTEGHIGFNTNVYYLTPDKYDGILQNTSNIILSFFNTGDEYERLTGTKEGTYNKCYQNAINFIKYRDQHKPNYEIFIGCNRVAGHSLDNVKQAFAGFNVRWAIDAELRWGGSVITGVIDRMVMYNNWRCDGYKGALQVKYNGDCEFCAYDIIGSKEGGETKFANLLTDSWEEINTKFKSKFKSGTSLCQRCDYWYDCKAVIANNFVKPDLSKDWQIPHLKEGEGFYD